MIFPEDLLCCHFLTGIHFIMFVFSFRDFVSILSRSPASAIVAPFNYKPSPAAAAVKRNTSYVSSIGRRREEEVTASEEEEEMKILQTSSAMVTLV